MCRFLFTCFFLLSFRGIFAQQQIEHTISSKVFGSDRKVTVFLPAVYSLDPKGRLPVAYLFDGQFEPYLKMVSGMMEYYHETNLGTGLILVSVHTDSRFGEFVPEPKRDSITGKTTYSTPLTDFLHRELFPFIDSAYRTTAFKMGIGHSLGGTFLLYEAFKDNSPFGAVIAASPNTNIPGMTQLIPEYLEKHPDMNTFLYVTGGDTDQMELDFLRTTMQIDSAIRAGNFKSLDWNFRKYEHSNHMETFPKTFNDGYLLFTKKWRTVATNFAPMKGLQGAALEEAIKKLLAQIAASEQTEKFYSFREVYGIQSGTEQAGEYQISSNICELLLSLLEKDTTLSKEDKDANFKWLKEKQLYLQFQDICRDALAASNRKDYKTAAREYSRAFKLELIRGTYYERMNSLESLAQSGNTEEAFKQLDLLANRFKLRGSDGISDNPLLEPLHKDKRWKKYIRILDENRKLKDYE